jgi:hypothetical protein
MYVGMVLVAEFTEEKEEDNCADRARGTSPRPTNAAATQHAAVYCRKILSENCGNAKIFENCLLLEHYRRFVCPIFFLLTCTLNIFIENIRLMNLN